MKSRILAGGLLAVILALSVSCNPKTESNSAGATVLDTANIKAEIQAIEDRFAQTFNTGNADSLTYYAEDAVSFFDNQPPKVGISEIKKFILEELAFFPKGAKISFETKEVHISSDGNQVVEVGKFTTKDSTNAIMNGGNYISVFEKRNGKYVCIRDMSSNEPITQQ